MLRLYNRSWIDSILPPIWKKAEIVALLKKGKPAADPSSYRPISLLSCLGKAGTNKDEDLVGKEQ